MNSGIFSNPEFKTALPTHGGLFATSGLHRADPFYMEEQAYETDV